jgi:hypothetical protein
VFLSLCDIFFGTTEEYVQATTNLRRFDSFRVLLLVLLLDCCKYKDCITVVTTTSYYKLLQASQLGVANVTSHPIQSILEFVSSLFVGWLA